MRFLTKEEVLDELAAAVLLAITAGFQDCNVSIYDLSLSQVGISLVLHGKDDELDKTNPVIIIIGKYDGDIEELAVWAKEHFINPMNIVPNKQHKAYLQDTLIWNGSRAIMELMEMHGITPPATLN